MRKLPLCIVFTLVLFVSLATTAPCLGDDFPEVVNSQAEGESPPTPEEAAASFTPPDGFEVELFAGEPDVQQPIGFSIDDRGRLWVAECYSYQGRGFTDEQRDRIVILEDTNHDGQFDRRKVFWDEGRQLSSVLPGFGGLYILNHGCLQFIADRDGDDVPDAAPETLIDGFDRSKVSHN